MGGNTLLLLTLMLCLGQRVLSVDITTVLQPENLVLSPDISMDGSSFSATCRLNNLDEQTYELSSLTLKRNASGDPGNDFKNVVVYLRSSNRLVIGTDLPTLTVDNSSTSTSFSLRVNIEQTRCQDAGTYKCMAAVFNIVDATSPELVADKDLNVEVSPGNITMVPDPRGETAWTVGQTLTLLCSASVGTVSPESQIEFKWQFSDNGPWLDYTNQSDITIGDPVPNVEGCYERWSSTLTRVLTTEDTGREYQCFVRRNGIDYLQFARVHSVGTVNEVGFTTTPPPSAGDSGGTSKANVPGIVGGVVGGLVGVIIIIIIVVFVIRRKSASQRDNAEEPSEHKLPENSNQPMSAYPTGPYGQPRPIVTREREREPQGTTNKAMEEPSPHNPPRYANDFHQGQRNRAYERAPSGGSRSRYSSDDDGTDSRVNTSQHSIGYGDPTLGTAI